MRECFGEMLYRIHHVGNFKIFEVEVVDGAADNHRTARGKERNQHEVEERDARADTEFRLFPREKPSDDDDCHAAERVGEEERVEAAFLPEPDERVQDIVRDRNSERREKPQIKDRRHGENRVEEERNVQSVIEEKRAQKIKRDGNTAEQEYAERTHANHYMRKIFPLSNVRCGHGEGF